MVLLILSSTEAKLRPFCFYNRTVRLNGKVLKLVDDRTLPDLMPKSVPGYDPLILPPLTFGFYVIPEASASACG